MLSELRDAIVITADIGVLVRQEFKDNSPYKSLGLGTVKDKPKDS